MRTKTGIINIRLSETDMKYLKKAQLKYQKETGKKPMISKVILYAVKQYVES